MKKWMQVSLLTACVLLLMASGSGNPSWRMKADYVEACSCHLFCPCYFNKHAEHPHCEFNMAVKVHDGHSGKTDLTGAKYWLTGDLGDEWGTNKKGDGEKLTVADEKALEESREWSKHNKGIPHGQVLAELGITKEEIDRFQEPK